MFTTENVKGSRSDPNTDSGERNRRAGDEEERRIPFVAAQSVTY